MFNKKLTTLGERPVEVNLGGAVQPAFVKAGMNEQKRKEAVSTSANGGMKYITTGNEFVDQFGKVGQYRTPRAYVDIANDQDKLWKINPLLAVCFILYVRMITRKVTLFSGQSTSVSQKGAELKHEGIFRMIWLHVNAPDTFWKNIGLFVSVGSWKDIFTMLEYDVMWNGWNGRVLHWDKFASLIKSGLENKNTVNLVKKYMPHVVARKKCTTIESEASNIVAKWLCSKIFDNKENDASAYAKYRKMKSSGTAHEWQKLISTKQFERIDFSQIHGRALNKLVRSKFLKNQGLSEKYADWVKKPETNVKYVGFVHELFMSISRSMAQHEKDTVNKQFMTLIEKAGQTGEFPELIVVRDVSGSMNTKAVGLEMRSGDVAKAIALYFSYFLRGKFSNAWIEFAGHAKMRDWSGTTPLDKWFNESNSGYAGTTDFQQVIDLFCNIKASGVPEADFPRGILCISDGEFNRTRCINQTNVQAALRKLLNAGFSASYVNDFIFTFWDIPNGYSSGSGNTKFETFGDIPNVFYMSGYSASVVSFLSGKVANADDLMKEALSQEILKMVEL